MIGTTIEQLNNNLTYQLPSQEVDVERMVNSAQGRLPVLRRRAVAAAFDSPGWGNKDLPSLRSFPYRRHYRDFSPGANREYMIDPVTGAINVPSSELFTSRLGDYFNPLRKWEQDGFSRLRGLTYFTSVDFSKDTPEKRLAVMTADISEGLDMVASVDRRTLGEMDYLIYLGILDHIKVHLLTAFHALTFREREGIFPKDVDYMSIRKKAQGLATTATRAYYKGFLGQPFDPEFDPEELKNMMGEVVEHISGDNHLPTDFTLPEVFNPVTILLGAHEAARRKQYPKTIIGIPSGGSEVAMATGLMYETLNPNLGAPNIALISLSFHYRAKQGAGLSREQLIEMIEELSDVRGQRVLIVDDNSNSGSTLQTMAEALIETGAERVGVHIAELDPKRVKAKHETGKDVTYGVVNMDHPDFYTAMGISASSDKNGQDLRRKWVKKQVEKTHEQVEKRMLV